MISDLKDLKALFKLCRAQGITDLKLNGIEIKLGNLPEERYQANDVDEGALQEPSQEDILFWSSDRGQEILDKKVGLKS